MTLWIVLLGCLSFALAAASWLLWLRIRQAKAEAHSLGAQLEADGSASAASNSLTGSLVRLQQLLSSRLHDTRQTAALQQKLTAALDNINEGIAICDAKGAIVFRNASAQSFARTPHSEVLVEAAMEELLAEALKGKTAQREIQFYGPPDQTLLLQTFPLSLASQPPETQPPASQPPESQPVDSQTADSPAAVAVIDDISHRQRLDIIRRDLVTNIGHELRTPVGALSVLADAMQDEDDPEVLISLSQSIGKESVRLTQIVEDLLELSRLEQNQDGQLAPVILQDVVRRAVTRITGAAQRSNAEIQIGMAEEPVCVWGDSLQLTSAAFNLLDNALKYSPSGRPLSIDLLNKGAWAEIVVTDEGVGIPRRDHDRVFERFYRVDRSRPSAMGSGLGLAVVRHVAQQHEGEVTLQSEEGMGSTFTIRLPVHAEVRSA